MTIDPIDPLDPLDANAVVAATALDLPLEPVDAAQRVDGDPLTGFAVLGELDDLEIGVWEMTAGAMSDTEADEVFVVLRGSASVAFLDEGRSIELAAGDVVRLRAGQRTIWTVREALRKIYLTRP